MTHDDTYSIGWVLRPLAAARRRLLIAAVLGVLIGAAYFLFAPREYVSGLTLLPGSDEGGSLLSGAGELAALAGLQLPGGTDPSLVYPTVLRSDDLLDAVLSSTDDEGGTLRAALGFDDDDGGRTEAREALLDRLRVRRDPRSAVVTVRVSAESPELAVRLADTFHAELDRYYRETRSTRAGRQRGFLEDRVQDVADRLREAEEALSEFRESNRGPLESPELLLRESRLDREVLIRQTAYLELIKQLELARIAEHRDTPVLEALDVAIRPVRAASPRPVRSVAVSLFLCLFLTICHAYVTAYTLPLLRRELGAR